MVMSLSRIIVTFMVCAALVTAVSAATIRVTPQTNTVTLDETFRIHFDVDGVPDGVPDFTPLYKDFQVLSTNQSSNLSIINGQVSNTKRWSVTVLAREAGMITIPPISFGLDTSPAVPIEVTSQELATDSGQQGNNDIFLEATVSSPSAYVQSEVIYTLKLFRSVAITRASLTDPELTWGDAVIEKIGDDRNYEVSLDGTPYLVIERNYAVYPQASGTITIAPVNFMGQVPRTPYSFDPFGAQPRTVIRRSEPVTLNVRQIPGAFQGNHWLPARNVTIAEEWSADPLNLRVGEPVTRTLILSARGLTASQLPELPAENLPDLRFYPDRPVLANDKTVAGIAATRREKAALIPGQAGSYLLPEIVVPWWNTVTDRPEFAVIPERTIQVRPGPVDNGITGVTPPLQQPIDSVLRPVETQLIPDILQTSETGTGSDTNIWKWISVILVVILSSMLLSRRTQPAAARKVDELTGDVIKKSDTTKDVIKDITASCQQGDSVKTRQNIMRWARLRWPASPVISLGEIAERVEPALAVELHKLNDAVYGNKAANWEAERFLQAFNNEPLTPVNTKDKKNNDKEKLEPLYRIR